MSPGDDEQHTQQAQVVGKAGELDDVNISSEQARFSTSSSTAHREPEATTLPSSALLGLPRELRDMIYAELAVHHADVAALKALPIPHGYQYNGVNRIESLCMTPGFQPHNLPDTRTYLNLQLICHQVKIEIEEFRASMKHMDAELELICKAPRIFIPLWTQFPLLRPDDQLININVILRLRTYELLQQGDFIFDFIHALIEHQPTSRKWEPWASCMIERVRARVGFLKITTVCEDMYTPGQYRDKVTLFQARTLRLQKWLFLEEIAEVVDIDGLRISTDTGLSAKRREWYKVCEGNNASALWWHDAGVSTERPAWDIYD